MVPWCLVKAEVCLGLGRQRDGWKGLIGPGCCSARFCSH